MLSSGKLSAVALACLASSLWAPASEAVDVVVYGATASGTMAAVAAAQQGASVVLLEPRNHVGGMLSGGLGRTDMDRQENVIGGLALEFFRRAGKHYGQEIAWMFEPHVAEKILKEMLAEQKVSVKFGQALASIEQSDSRIRSLKTTDGTEYTAKVFIDATYEGDLMKAAGVSYKVGREGRDTYGESLAGRRDILRSNHQINYPISPWKDGKLLPHITAEEDLAATGAGDGKFQAYNFRLCLTNVEANRIPITKPEGYDPARYELLRRCIEVGGENVDRILGIKPMPNGKSDVNAGYPISLNLPGANQDYPDGSPERRKKSGSSTSIGRTGLSISCRTTPRCPKAFGRNIRNGASARTSSPTPAAGRTSFTSAKPAR
jgi:Dehydrogenases (flavoproteins)